jgi:hypothetical protein
LEQLTSQGTGHFLSRQFSRRLVTTGWTMSYDPVPEAVSYDLLLQKMFDRSLAHLEDDDLVYFLELIQRLRELKERTDTEAWWFRYYR